MDLKISDAIGDLEMFAIASCIHQIENLAIHTWLATMNGFQILYAAIQSRRSPVRKQDNFFSVSGWVRINHNFVNRWKKLNWFAAVKF